ncbi:MAG: adenosine kinase [Gammaproteobacteria bacterium]|nr:adenosine kinase [Gammaproteobacteria bacterium]
MEKYDVYGVGNALVDLEFEVPESFFLEHDIEKGLMTLVTREQQERLEKVLIDAYGIKAKSGGGSAGNTMYALTHFGGRAFYSCKVANDATGKFFLEQLGHHNINTNVNVNASENGSSGRCLVMISPDAERTMHTYLGVSEKLSLENIDFETARQSDYIYIEGYLVTSPNAKAAVIELKNFAEKSETKIALTFSDPAMLEYFINDVNDIVGSGVDLLFCNEKELKLWAGTDAFDEACKAMEQKAKQFAITRGADGALVYDGKNYIPIAGNSVKAIDTNGAGDMFAGAFLYAISQGKDFESAGKFASRSSAEIVTIYGPRLSAERHEFIVKEVFG